MNIFCYCDMCLFLTLFSRKVKQSFITVGAKRVFSHSLLLRNINSIIFIKLFFFLTMQLLFTGSKRQIVVV